MLTHDSEKGCIELNPPGIALSDAKAYLDEGEPEWAIKECVDGLEGGENGCHEVLSRAYNARHDLQVYRTQHATLRYIALLNCV